MGTSEATITWSVGDEKLIRNVGLRDNKLLLSQYFLQSLLPPSNRFVALNAVIQVGELYMNVETPSQWDIDGHQHFLLDSTLSTNYVLEHCLASAYISDSENNIAVCHPHRSSSDNANVVDKPSSTDKKPTVIDLEATYAEKLAGNKDVIDLDEKPKNEWKSIVSWILEAPGSARLKQMIKISREPLQVNDIPRSYNGNIIFELPPTRNDMKRME